MALGRSYDFIMVSWQGMAGRKFIHPVCAKHPLSDVSAHLVVDIPKEKHAKTTHWQTSFYHSFIYFVLNTTGLYFYSCQDSFPEQMRSPAPSHQNQKPHSICNLNPILAFTLKPRFNPQIALWHHDNQPECHCFPKITLFCKYNVYFILTWHEQEHTHTNTQLYWTFSWGWTSDRVVQIVATFNQNIRLSCWLREKIKWVHSHRFHTTYKFPKTFWLDGWMKLLQPKTNKALIIPNDTSAFGQTTDVRREYHTVIVANTEVKDDADEDVILSHSLWLTPIC